MKQKILFIIIFTIYAAAVIGQTNTVSKILNGPAFESLTISGPVTVELIESENTTVETFGDYDYVNGIHTRWSKKNLQLTYSKNESSANAPVKIYVKKLVAITVEDGARVITTKPFHCNAIRVTVNGPSYARIINYGDINIASEETISIKKFRYNPDAIESAKADLKPGAVLDDVEDQY